MLQRKSQAPLIPLWHRIPWNALFWVTVFGVVGSTLFFAVQVEMARRHVLVDNIADVKNGDVVKVVLVLNGDEVVIEKNRERARLRMLAIRSFDPVVNEFEITSFGRASVNFLDKWLLNQKATVHFDKTIRDVKGRYLGYLEKDGVDINQRMVEEGISMVYTEFPTARENNYLSIEQLARDARRGIWGGTKSVQRITALRLQWAGARQTRDGQAPPDPLIEQAMR